MKRRSRTPDEQPDRAQLEAEAMAELQRAAGAPPNRPSSPSRANRPAPAWGAPTTPSPPVQPAWEAADPEPEWRPSHGSPGRSSGRRAEAAGPEEDEEEVGYWSDEVDEGDEDEEWYEEDDEDVADGNQPIRLLGVPLDYDATGIALQQLAERSNVRRPAPMVTGVDNFEAERIRDQAMAKFLEGQKLRARQEAERAAAAAGEAPAPAPTKRAAYPPLSPGLSAKNLVMQPVTPPPLNRAAGLSPELAAAGSEPKAPRAKPAAKRTVPTKKSVAEAPPPAKAAATKKGQGAPGGTGAAKKAVTKKAVTTKRGVTAEAAPAPTAPSGKRTSAKSAKSAEKAAAAKAPTPTDEVEVSEVATAPTRKVGAAAKKVGTRAARAPGRKAPAVQAAPPTEAEAEAQVEAELTPAPAPAPTARKVAGRPVVGTAGRRRRDR